MYCCLQFLHFYWQQVCYVVGSIVWHGDLTDQTIDLPDEDLPLIRSKGFVCVLLTAGQVALLDVCYPQVTQSLFKFRGCCLPCFVIVHADDKASLIFDGLSCCLHSLQKQINIRSTVQRHGFDVRPVWCCHVDG